mgnify:FL=1
MSDTETAHEIGSRLRSLGRQLRECSDAVWRLKGSPEHDSIAREVWQLGEGCFDADNVLRRLGAFEREASKEVADARGGLGIRCIATSVRAYSTHHSNVARSRSGSRPRCRR